jgi:hypothetical protein
MICAITARRVLDGKADEFFEKFSGGADQMPEEIRDRFKAVYACKDVTDPNTILTFGLFDGTLDELREIQSTDHRDEQLDGISPLVEEVLFDGSFEVITDLIGAAAR